MVWCVVCAVRTAFSQSFFYFMNWRRRTGRRISLRDEIYIYLRLSLPYISQQLSWALFFLPGWRLVPFYFCEEEDNSSDTCWTEKNGNPSPFNYVGHKTLITNQQVVESLASTGKQKNPWLLYSSPGQRNFCLSGVSCPWYFCWGSGKPSTELIHFSWENNYFFMDHIHKNATIKPCLER